MIGASVILERRSAQGTAFIGEAARQLIESSHVPDRDCSQSLA